MDNSENIESFVPPPDVSQISNFYKDRCILITGVTGFVGKVLLEKLLRSCSGLKNVYVLMRPKKGKDVRQRLDELLTSTLFEALRAQDPNAVTKVIPIKGDIMMPSLGLCDSDRSLLKKTVSVVFHSAATVQFNEPLRISLEMNAMGTKRILDLCHKMTKLQALVHVSTAYCNCDKKEVLERVYPLSTGAENMVDSLGCLDDEILESITPKLLGSLPNTYTFTKAVAENLLFKKSGNLPVAIVRPSIVTAAWKEPYPGWVDNLNGATGVLLSIGKGFLRSGPCKDEHVVDCIPVDITVNLLIATAWYTATHKPAELTVYHCASGIENKLLFKTFRELCTVMRTNPTKNLYWIPNLRYRCNQFLCDMDGLFQYIPSCFLDLVVLVIGKKPIFMKIQKKVISSVKLFFHFFTHEWRFFNTNVAQLWQELSSCDRERFPFDVKQIVWKDYLECYWQGIKTFVLKDDATSTAQGKTQLSRMNIIAKIFTIVKFTFILYFLRKKFTTKQTWCLTLIWCLCKYLYT